MAVYCVEFPITISACVNIEAANDDQAVEIAQRLVYESSYFVEDELMQLWDDQLAGWNDPDDPKVLFRYEGEQKPDYTMEELAEYIDMDDLEEE